MGIHLSVGQAPRGAAAMAVALLLAGLSGCSSGSPESIGRGTSTMTVAGSSEPVSVEIDTTSVVATSSTSRVLAPPVTVAEDPDAVAVIAGLGPQLLGSDAEKACVVRRLSADAALLDRVRGGVSVGSKEFEQLLRFSSQCTISETVAPLFVERLSAARGGLSDEAHQCLRTEVAALTDEELEVLTSAGVNPQGSQAPRGGEVLRSMFVKCGVPN